MVRYLIAVPLVPGPSCSGSAHESECWSALQVKRSTADSDLTPGPYFPCCTAAGSPRRTIDPGRNTEKGGSGPSSADCSSRIWARPPRSAGSAWRAPRAVVAAAVAPSWRRPTVVKRRVEVARPGILSVMNHPGVRVARLDPDLREELRDSVLWIAEQERPAGSAKADHWDVPAGLFTLMFNLTGQPMRLFHPDQPGGDRLTSGSFASGLHDRPGGFDEPSGRTCCGWRCRRGPPKAVRRRADARGREYVG